MKQLESLDIDGLQPNLTTPPPPDPSRIGPGKGHWGRLAAILWEAAHEQHSAHRASGADGYPEPVAAELHDQPRSVCAYLSKRYNLRSTVKGVYAVDATDKNGDVKIDDKSGQPRRREYAEMVWVWVDPVEAATVFDAANESGQLDESWDFNEDVEPVGFDEDE